ncbi:MAG: redoxin domain-containing protein [Candidatus Kapaibacterium sp.]|jgi:peroxiredoxin
MSLSVGDQFVDVTLYDSNREKKSLSSFLESGPLVIAFFPGAFTGVCDKEVCSLRDSMTRYSEIGANVVGISIDGPFALKEFAAKYQLNFTLLSDFQHTAVHAYGVPFSNLGGVEGYNVANRAVFIVDTTGVIRYAWSASPNPGVEPNYEELVSTVAALKS